MAQTEGNKHTDRSAQTRDRFIQAAQKLFAERSVDSVSMNEITIAAGQKNRNALQYHFGNRDGLLQAIIDTHVVRVRELRQSYLADLVTAHDNAHLAARALIEPLADYVEENPGGIYYVKILSQLAALNSVVLNPTSTSGLSFQYDDNLEKLLRQALAHLQPVEMKRRIFLALSITFHGIADICRASEISDTSPALKERSLMFEQITLAVASLLAAPPVEEQPVRQ